MWKVWIHDNDTLTSLQFEQNADYENFHFEAGENGLKVESKDTVILMDKNTTRTFSDTAIRCQDTKTENWSVYQLESCLKIGRASYCQLRLLSSTVSNHHLTIQKEDGYHLYDQNSTNGTFVNGKRTASCRLKSGDQICFGDIEAYLVKDYLIINRSLNTNVQIESDSFNSESIALPEKDDLQINLPVMQRYELELPQMYPKLKKGNLFQAIGSSILILASGLASGLVVWLVSPEHMERVYMMLMTSASMCLAFLLYGLINREIQWKEKIKEQINGESEYRKYIQSCELELDQLKNEYENQVVNILQIYSRLTPSSFRCFSQNDIYLCPGCVPQNWITIHTGKSGYQYHDNKLYQYLITVIQNWSSPVMSPAFMQAKETSQISFSQVPYIFIQWCWLFWNPSRKWVWIGDDDQSNLFTAFEGCHEGHIRLAVKSVDDVERIQRVIDDKKEYVVYYTDDKLLKKMHFPENSIYLKGVSHSGFESMEHTYSPGEKLLEFQRYRRLENRHKLQFQDLFGIDPKPSDKVDLTIVLGLDEKGQPIRFDLSEYGDGPHGFIAGMTGSGKSELISSLLMQLVLNNDPNHLQYLIVDFKGGAFGQTFYNFSHCGGMLTNLDRDEVSRFQQGIHFEVQRRQKLLKEFTSEQNGALAHIDAYNNANPSKCISHLFIIVDELAQLKAEAPEFMANLKEIARVGRSLGIHCLLSTQKPLGIIDDQVLANSKFKICLSVSSKADSQEVLHHDRAYRLSGSGQFILQIQNRDMEYIGQSFWLQQKMEDKSSFWMEVDDKDEILAHSSTRKIPTISQYYSQKVLDMYPKHPYVIPLFDQSIFRSKQEVMAVIDFCQRNEQQDWNISFGQSAILLCKDLTQIHQLVSAIKNNHQEHPVYTAGISQLTCDFTELAELSSIDRIVACCTMIVSVPSLAALDPYISILFHKKVRLFCFLSQYHPRDVNLLHIFTERICFSSDSIDELRSFFELFVPVSTKVQKGKGLVRVQDDVYPILFQICHGDIQSPLQNVFRYKNEKKGYCVGLYQGKRVYWSGQRKLLICYAQKSRRELIEKLLDRWKDHGFIVTNELNQPFDICVLNMITDLNQVNSQTYKELMYDLDVMWVGAGFEDYSYSLKKKASRTNPSKNYLWQQDEILTFDLLEEL